MTDTNLISGDQAPHAEPVQEPEKAKEVTKPAFPPPSSRPTQAGLEDIRFDFNAGARVELPPARRWRIRLEDADTGNIVFANENSGALVRSAKRYFIRFRLTVWDLEKDSESEPVFLHEYSAAGKTVVVQFPIGTLSDTIGWFPYAERFARKHDANLVCAMSGLIIALFRDEYPNITFVSHEELVEQKLAENSYATYSLGLFFDDKDHVHQPSDFRLTGLYRTAGYILGVDLSEQAPGITIPDNVPPIAGPYVCIAVQASTQCKYWNNPHGWSQIVSYLKSLGYRVICIDQKAIHGSGIVWNYIPHGAEDETGYRSLIERARWLHHARLYIGLSSGLSWLAWAAGTPVVMISGFTHPTNEFAATQRVINWHACNSCWNDPLHRFDHNDFLWCPRHAGTLRQFECSKLITAHQVKMALVSVIEQGAV